MASPAVTDRDGNGLVDGSEASAYQLFNGGDPITLSTRRGRTFSAATSRQWNVIAGTENGDGFMVLRAKQTPRRGTRYKIWSTDEFGIINRKTRRWVSGKKLADAGWENVFDRDFNDDGLIGNQPPDEPDPVNDGSAAFAIEGLVETGEILSITRTADDPDGNGTESIEWEASNQDGSWSWISAEEQLTITTDLEGRQLRATISYTDGDGFQETVSTEAVLIPVSDPDDYGNTPDSSGSFALGSSLQGELETIGDRDWFAINVVAGNSYEFTLIGNSLTDPYLRLFDSKGAIISSNDDDGFSLNSRLVHSPDISETLYLGAGAYVDGLAGTYTISAVELLPDESTDDFGDSPESSGLLEIGTSIQGELEQARDRDWFAINLEAGGNYSFELTGITLEDPLLILRDADGTTLSSDDDGGDGYNSRINFSTERTGSYYLDAGSYADRFSGSYLVSSAEIPPPPPGYSFEDGYGHVSASRAFEELLSISLTDVPSLGGNLWGLDNVGAPEVWAGGENFDGVSGAGVTVAVIDTGVDLDHPEFQGRLVPGYDFVDDDNEADDGNSHGTHVAGTIAGASDGAGITGVAPDAKIMPIRVLDDEGYGWTSDIIAGVRWAADNGADVINLSLGGGGYSKAMADAIAHASGLGAVVVMAAGNSGGGSPDYPAAHAVNDGLAVGAVDQQRSMAGFSNRAGSTVLDYVTAPGVDIYSAIPGGGYSNYNGTSMATPHVAGVAALLKSHDRSMAPTRIEDLLTGTAGNGNTGSARSTSSQNIDGLNQNHLITLETIDSFSDEDLLAPLIGNLSGNRSMRRATAHSIDELMSSDSGDFIHVDTFEVIDATRHKFAAVDLSDHRHADRAALLKDLLSSNQFEYFEIDQPMTIA